MRHMRGAFTLLELLTAIFIAAILMLMLAQSLGGFQNRADFSLCVTNLRSIYVAASAYIQEQGHWPQINPKLIVNGGTQYADQWYDALKKFGIARKVWVCPTVQRQLKSPDLDRSQNYRTDYISTPFDDKPLTPYRWSNQPWFIEKSSSHPGGNLMIFSDGQAMPMKDALRRAPPAVE
jgi:prepilin-type N-terminal cleavage/methylation domain-containing protein